jgi:class 3 adenylate cyclase/predicted ATPase
MKFSELLEQVQQWLQRDQRVSYRALKREFDLDDEDLEDLKAELIEAKRLAVDENGKVLVWLGASLVSPSTFQVPSSHHPDPGLQTLDSSPIDGERKTITALFADIKGSMNLIEGLDPEEARSLIDPALRLMIAAVRHYNGYVAQSTGDGIFALFGAPVAYEDHPQRALYAALKMQEDGKRYAEQLRRTGKPPIELRVGVNTGEVVVRSIQKDELHADYVPIGHSTSLAARLQSLAMAGSTVVSEQTYQLTEGYFQFAELGPATIKGVSDAINIYQVVGVGPLRTRLQVAASRGLVRFVGRQQEVAQLQQALESAKRRRGQIVGVRGEPGVGKSRLFHEFKLRFTRGCLVLDTFSVSHGKAYPYLPLIELLKNYFQLTVHDDERTRREKIGGKVLMLDRSLEDILPYLFLLLDVAEPQTALQQMAPQIRRRRTFDALNRLFLRESQNQPLILIFEDLHWLDNETQAFLIMLSESLATANILLLVNYRPEYEHGWNSKPYYTTLQLVPFGQDDAQELLTVLLGDGGRQHIAPLRQFILEKTQGNPFFIEEIVQALCEQGMLIAADAGEGLQPALTFNLSSLRLPTTVQGILASRIDRLPADEKMLLQTLAVIGKEFSFSLLKQTVQAPETELQRRLAHLQTAEFLYEQPAFPEVEYTFKHALTQEVAYNSLLIERRKALHEQAAQAIEEVYRGQLDKYYSELAHHYGRSGNTEKAIDYLYLAGRQAARFSAHTEAISHLTTALQMLGTLADTPERAQRELSLQLALAASLQVIKGPSVPEVEHAYTRAYALLQQEEDLKRLFSVLRGLWVLHHVRANLATARELGEQLLTIAEQTQDSALLLEAHRALGSTLMWLGEFSPARVHLEQAIARYDSHSHRSLTLLYGGADPGVSCLCELARVLWFLGYPEQALQKSQAALTLAGALSDPFSLGYALVFGAGLHQFRREGQAAQQRAEEGIALAREYGFASLLSAGTIRRGWALAEQGQGEAGLRQMQQGLLARRTTGAELAHPYFLAAQAEVYGKIGQIEQALTLVTEALTATYAIEERRLEAELYRLKGELTLQQLNVQGSQF